MVCGTQQNFQRDRMNSIKDDKISEEIIAADFWQLMGNTI